MERVMVGVWVAALVAGCSVETSDGFVPGAPAAETSGQPPPEDDAAEGSTGETAAGSSGAAIDDESSTTTGSDEGGSTIGVQTTSGAPVQECGNGLVEGAEECDGGEVANGICTKACEVECDETFDDCNADVEADGCETWLWTREDCGDCGNDCEVGTACVEQVCTEVTSYGPWAELPEQTTALSNHLLGNRITVAADGDLTHLSLFAKGDGLKGQLALYADVDGAPAGLVAATDEVRVYSGYNEFPMVPAVPITAGDYWLLAVYNGNTLIGLEQIETETVHHIDHTFGTPLPDPFPAAETYQGQRLNYYVNVVP